MIKTSLDFLQRSSTIFGDLPKFLENVHKRSSGLRTGFGESSENRQKYCVLRILYKKIHGRLEIQNFSSRV